MSLADVIESMGVQTYTVKRSGAQAWESGVAILEDESSFTIRALVTPLGGRDLMRLPEGDRTKERRSVLTKTALNAMYPGGKADVVVIDEEDWEVSTVEAWTQFGFWKATVTRVDR